MGACVRRTALAVANTSMLAVCERTTGKAISVATPHSDARPFF